MKINLKGNTSQATTTGKNLLKNTNVNSGDNNYWASYSTYDEETGTLTRSTTLTTESFIPHKINLKSNTKYTISCLAKSNGYVRNLDIFAYNSTTTKIYSKSNISLTTNFQKYSFTFTTDSTDFTNSTIRFDNNGSTQSGTEAILIIKDVMLVEGEDTEFEPYTNGASPNPDYPQDIHVVSGDNSINVCGKNLFTLKNISNATNLGVERTINNSELKLNGTSSGAGPIIGRQTSKVTLSAGTYSILVQKKSGTVTPNGYQTAFYFRKPNGTEITSFLLNNYWGNYSFKTTFVLSEATEIYIEIYCNGAGYTLDNLELQFYIESGYNLTPTYEPYIGNTYPVNLPVENLLPNNGITETKNGITFTKNADNTITLNGTATADTYTNVWYNTTNNLINDTNQVYTMSIGLSNSNVGLAIFEYVNNSWVNKKYVYAKSTTYTPSGSQTGQIFRVIVKNGATLNNVIVKPMLEVGTKVNTYVPYGTTPIELCKIGTCQDIIEKSTGKNFITFKNFIEATRNGVTTTPNNSELKLNGTVTQANPIFNSQSLDLMLPKGTYTITYKIARGSVTRPSGDIAFYLRNGTTNIATVTIYQILSNNNTFSQTFTIDNNASLYFYAYSNAGNIVFNNTVLQVQLEKGTQSTSFEPYGTGWYIKKEIGKIVLNGSEGWTYYQNRLILGQSASSINMIPSTNQVLCNYYAYTSQGQDKRFTTGNSFSIQVFDSSYTDNTTFKNWLSTHNMTVYYALNTPTITEITNSTLISQLNALAKSYASQTNISQESNDLASLLNATALEEM